MKLIKRFILLAAFFALSALLPAAALAAEQKGTVTASALNVRSGPGTGYERVGMLYNGNAVTITGTSGSWYAVKTDSLSGYVSKSYVRIESATSATESSSTLMRGSTGSKVKQLQGNLIYLGYLSGSADGSFGAKTEAAVKLYQRRNSLSADGKAGSKTNAAIQKEVLRVVNTVETAKKYLGMDYLYGGSSPSTGFDCSGLTQYAFKAAGISIPRNSAEQAKSGIAVPKSQLRAGDLVAFNSPVSHVGIYLGNGKFIHSPKTGDVVKITDLKYMNLTACRRFTGVLVNA